LAKEKTEAEKLEKDNEEKERMIKEKKKADPINEAIKIDDIELDEQSQVVDDEPQMLAP